MVFNLDMTQSHDYLQMTFINRSVVMNRAVTILRFHETYLRIGGLRGAYQPGVKSPPVCLAPRDPLLTGLGIR
jgi:hypothetical protein